MIMQDYFVGLEMLLEINKCDGCNIPIFFLMGGGGVSSDCLVFFILVVIVQHSCTTIQVNNTFFFLHFSTCSFDHV